MTDLVRVNGWLLLFDSLFLDQLHQLENQVRDLKAKRPHSYNQTNSFKRLNAINHLVFTAIPANPAAPEYRLGGALGANNRHWFRAKFYQQYRLFFRFDTKAKIIIFVWVNDESTLRAYESKNDAYLTFRKMIEAGNPPDSWAQLLDRAAGLD